MADSLFCFSGVGNTRFSSVSMPVMDISFCHSYRNIISAATSAFHFHPKKVYPSWKSVLLFRQSVHLGHMIKKLFRLIELPEHYNYTMHWVDMTGGEPILLEDGV